MQWYTERQIAFVSPIAHQKKLIMTVFWGIPRWSGHMPPAVQARQQFGGLD